MFSVYRVIIMIVHVGGGRCFCCHIGLGAVDPNHGPTASPWLPSTAERRRAGKCLDIYIICCLITALLTVFEKTAGRRVLMRRQKRRQWNPRKRLFMEESLAGEPKSLDHLEVLLHLDCPMDWTWFGQTHTCLREASQLCVQHVHD